jgi:hypothetical protein
MAMRNFVRTLVALVASLLFLVAAYAGIVISVKPHAVPAPPAGWKAYSDSKAGFAIFYPAGWSVNRNYVYPGFGPDHDIHGVLFGVPESLTRGTNLSTSLTGVSVESVTGNGKCDATRFIPESQDLRTLKDAGRVWSTANTQDAGAGNFYDVAVFALPVTKPCLAVRYTIHSTNIGNYDPGTVKAFDRTGLIKKFAAIRHTLRLRGDK